MKASQYDRVVVSSPIPFVQRATGKDANGNATAEYVVLVTINAGQEFSVRMRNEQHLEFPERPGKYYQAMIHAVTLSGMKNSISGYVNCELFKEAQPTLSPSNGHRS